MRSRASTPNLTSLAGIFCFLEICVGERRLGNLLLGGGNVSKNAHDVALLHDQQLLAVDLDFGAGPLAEQHAIANPNVDRDQLAALVTAAGTNGDDFALGRLFLWQCRE